MKRASLVNLAAGIWLVFAPSALYFGSVIGSSTAENNAIVCGVVAIFASLWSLILRTGGHAPAWINLLVGLWLVMSPWVLGFNDTTGALWSTLVAGGAMTVASAARMAVPV